jgi:hypothetical protein
MALKALKPSSKLFEVTISSDELAVSAFYRVRRASRLSVLLKICVDWLSDEVIDVEPYAFVRTFHVRVSGKYDDTVGSYLPH